MYLLRLFLKTPGSSSDDMITALTKFSKSFHICADKFSMNWKVVFHGVDSFGECLALLPSTL